MDWIEIRCPTHGMVFAHIQDGQSWNVPPRCWRVTLKGVQCSKLLTNVLHVPTEEPEPHAAG